MLAWLRAWVSHFRRDRKSGPALRAGASGFEITRRSAFDDAVEQLAARPDGGAGRLRAVSVVDFRETVAEKWPRLSDKVAIIVESLIRRHIGSGNLFQRQEEDCWVLAFMTTDSEGARRISTRIAQEISRHLLGEGCVSGRRPQAVVAHVGPRHSLDRNGCIDPALIRKAINDSRSLVDEAAGARMDAGPSGWKPVVRDEGITDLYGGWKEMKSDRVRAESSLLSETPPLPANARLGLLWRPTWVAHDESISAYCARVLRVDYAGAATLEGTNAYPPRDAASAAIIDRFVSATAVRDLRAAMAAGKGAAIIVPLAWSTLVGEAKNDVVSAFADLTPDIRAKLLRLEIFQVPDDVEPAHVVDITKFINDLCGQVLLRLDLTSPLLERMGELGAAQIGLDLSELKPEQRTNDERLLSALDGIEGDARRAGLGAYLWSARRRNLVGSAVDHGFAMVNGPGLMKDVGKPAIVVPAPKSKLGAGS